MGAREFRTGHANGGCQVIERPTASVVGVHQVQDARKLALQQGAEPGCAAGSFREASPDEVHENDRRQLIHDQRAAYSGTAELGGEASDVDLELRCLTGRAGYDYQRRQRSEEDIREWAIEIMERS